MKKNSLLFAIAAMVATMAVLTGGCSSPNSTVLTETVKPMNGDRQAYNFKLADLNGVQHSLTDYRGKKVYIEYWASWCPVCLGGIDDFEKLATINKNSTDVVVLSMVSAGAYGEKSSADFTQWFRNRGYNFPVLLDEGGQVARQFGVRAFPTSIFIGPDGALIAVNVGQYSNESITAKIKAIK